MLLSLRRHGLRIHCRNRLGCGLFLSCFSAGILSLCIPLCINIDRVNVMCSLFNFAVSFQCVVAKWRSMTPRICWTDT